ncbi:GATA type zinc finger [Ceratobasidium sp. AG-Ba]|nr:GATA type zinc finger [Ceratobasidium sp. AG-Ba]
MASVSPLRHSSPGSPVHTQLQHPLNQPRVPQRSPVEAHHPASDPQRSPSRDASATAAYSAGRQQPLPRNFPAPPINAHPSKTAADNAALDAATAAIARAGTSLDVGDTMLLNDLCERLNNPDLYTRPITRQRIIELLEIASEEIAKTRAAGLWEITARVAQERHFVCPPQMEGTVKSYIKMVDTVNEHSSSFDEDELIARLAKINQSKPFQANIPANTACLFCRRRKIKCDGSLPQCDMCAKHRQAKCEYPQKSHYGGFSNRGGLHYVVPMGPDIAAAAASAVPGASPPAHLDPTKPVKGYAPPAPAAAPTYILPGPPPPGSNSSSSMHGGSQRIIDAPASGRHESALRRDSCASSTGAPSHYDPIRQGPSKFTTQSQRTEYSSRRDAGAPEGHREKSWEDGFGDEDEDDARPASSSSSQILQSRHGAHLAHNGNQDVEMEDGEGANGVPRRRSPHSGHERCINCDTDKTSLWRKDEDGRTICNACQIYFRVHGRKRPPSMRSSTVKKRPGRQPRPSTGPLPLPGQELYIHRIDDDAFAPERPPAHHVLRPKPPMAHPNHPGRSRASSGSRSPPPAARRHSPPPAEYVHQQQQHLRVIEQAIANGQRTQPARTTGLDYALSGSRSAPRTQNPEGYRGRAADYVSGQDHPISPEARNSYNRDTRAQHHHSPSADATMTDAIPEDRPRREPHLSRRVSDEHRGEHPRRDGPAETDEETEVQAGENLCAVEGGRSPADVLVFRFDADRAKSVCATQWAHLRSPNRSVEDDLRFHLNLATDWLPKAGVYSITSGDEPPSSHHMAPPPNGKLNQTIDITSEIREGLNTLKFTQLRDMSDCVLVVQIWKVGRKGAGAPPRGAAGQPAQHNGMSPPGSVPDKHHTRPSHSTRGPPVYEAAPSPDLPPYNSPPPGRHSKPRNSDKLNGVVTPTGSRRGCLYCYNNHITCRPSHQENLGCEECLRRGIQCAMPEEYSPDLGYHASADRKPLASPALRSPPTHMPAHIQGPPAHPHAQPPPSTPLSPGSTSGSKRKQEEQLPPPPAPGSAAAASSKRPYKRRPTESTPPPVPQQAMPHMHHIQHVPPQPVPSGYAAALGASNTTRSSSNSGDSKANQELRRHQEMLLKQQQDAERENARVLAGGLPTPYA